MVKKDSPRQDYEVRFNMTIVGSMGIDDRALKTLLEKRIPGCVTSVIPHHVVPDRGTYGELECEVRNFTLTPR